jgi:hypothetical protein
MSGCRQHPIMRMRITKPPPGEYGTAAGSLLVGRVYNLEPSLASALLLEDCAEVYDLLSPEERRERMDSRAHDGWMPLNGNRPGWLRRP